MHKLTATLDGVLIQVFQLIFNGFYALSQVWWSIATAILLAACIAGLRIARFSNPNIPRWSQLIRHAATPLMCWPSTLLLGAVVLGWSILFTIANERGILIWMWLEMGSRLKGVGVGLAVGALLGGIIFYWLIPGLERPAKTEASPETKLLPSKNYDPEGYFRV